MGCEKRVIKTTRPGRGIIIDDQNPIFIPGEFETRSVNEKIGKDDFWTLLTIVVRENYNSELQSFADIAQVIYNRFGVSKSGQYYSGFDPSNPNNKFKTTPAANLKALILSPGQFEPAFRAKGEGYPSNSWQEISDYGTAVTAVRFDKNKGDFSKYTEIKAGEALLSAYNVLSNITYQQNSKDLIGGRTDFKSADMYKITDDTKYNCGDIAKCGIPTKDGRKDFKEDIKKEIENGIRGHFVQRISNSGNKNNAIGWAGNYKGKEVYELNIPWEEYGKGFPQLNS